jgi:hypothetical protein
VLVDPVIIAYACVLVFVVVRRWHAIVAVTDVGSVACVAGVVAAASPYRAVIRAKVLITDTEPDIVPVRVRHTDVTVRCERPIAITAFRIASTLPVITGVAVPVRVANTIAILVERRRCDAFNTLIGIWPDTAYALCVA